MVIKTLRQNANMTQKELAMKLDVTQACIVSWEKNESFPRADKLPKIAEVLGCEIADLFEKNNPSVSAEPSQLPLDKGAFVEVADATSDTCGNSET